MTPVTFTNLDRVMWPEVGMTKGDMIGYYESIAAVLLPHVQGRPMTLARFPTGVHDKAWYQTNCRGAPSWMEVAEIPGRRGAVHRMCVVNDLPSLLWVANQGTLELHPYLSTAAAFDEPVALVVDLDPGEPAGLADCCLVALSAREMLAADALHAAVKTSGARGLHLFVGLAPGATFGATRAYARSLARRLIAPDPARVTDAFPLGERVGKVLVDWRQNERSRSMVAPYSLRATPWPLVSTPVSWDEVEAVATHGDARPLLMSPATVLERVAAAGDLFGGALSRDGSIEQVA